MIGDLERCTVNVPSAIMSDHQSVDGRQELSLPAAALASASLLR